MIVVKEFGGPTLIDNESIFRAANLCVDEYKRGADVVMVVAAMGPTTAQLRNMGLKITDDPSRREMDQLMSTGEVISASLCTMALQTLGAPAISLNVYQISLRTSSRHGNARIRDVDIERIREELDQRKIVVIPGFQGVDKFGDITTLGAGGSATTAVAVAAALKANLCQIYTPWKCIYSADPKIVKGAVPLKEMSYDEALEFFAMGKKDIPTRAVGLAKKYGVCVEIRGCTDQGVGTLFNEVVTMEKRLIRGVVVNDSIARVSLYGLMDIPGIAYRVFSLLAQDEIIVNSIVQSEGADNTKEISFTVDKAVLSRTLEIIRENQQKLTCKGIAYDEKVSTVSIIGTSLASNPGVAAKMFEELYNANINIKMISSSEVRVTVMVDSKDAEDAANVLHEAFIKGV